MLKNVLRRLAQSQGYEIIGPPRAYAAEHTLASVLRTQGINLVVDVGANTGQFADEVRASGYRERIVSFEPQAQAHAELCRKAAQDGNWRIAERCAVGAEDGALEMNISGNSVSSSLLQMLPSHADAAPTSAYVRKELVPVRRLDDCIELNDDDRVLLKVDVQGYEGPVFDGAPRIFAYCSAIIVEMSLVPLYAGQTLALEMWERLAAAGFEPWSLEPGFRDPQSGRMLQLDGIFVRSKL